MEGRLSKRNDVINSRLSSRVASRSVASLVCAKINRVEIDFSARWCLGLGLCLLTLKFGGDRQYHSVKTQTSHR